MQYLYKLKILIVTLLQSYNVTKIDKKHCYINKKYYLCNRRYLIVLQLWQQQLSENQPLSDSGLTC